MNTAAGAAAYALDPLRDVRHREARSARDLADWLVWLELGGSAPATLDAYERTCADLLRAFPDRAFAEFTDGDLMHVLLRYPVKSRRIRKAHLASWFRWGFRTRRIPANPIDLLPVMKRPHQPATKVFSAVDAAKLCALPSPDGPLMTILFWTGMRQGEARNLTLRCFDLERGTLVVSEGAKGSRDRVIPLFEGVPQAVATLELLEGLGRDDYLWYDKPGGEFAIRHRHSKPIAETSFGRWWYRCLDAAGVPYVKRSEDKLKAFGNPHSSRHWFATTLKDAGVPIEDIQYLLGHASVATTSDLYVHSSATSVGQRVRLALDLATR